MLTRRSLFATSALLIAGAVAPFRADAQIGVQQDRNVPTAYAITNARIVPMSGSVIARGTIVVRNGLITAVGPSVTAPADARTVDGTGLTVYPGFIDAMSSLGIPAPRSGGGGGGAAAIFAAQQAAPAAPANARPAGQQPEVSATDLIRADAESFAAAHAAGFTAALTAPSAGIFVGQSAVISVRDGAPQDILVRAPVAMHIGFGGTRGFGGGYPTSLMGIFAVLRQTLLDAQHYQAEQAAYTANPRGMRRPANDPGLAALQPALARQMPVVMTANSQREIERALDLAKEFNLRVIIAGGREAHLVATRLRAENVPVLLSMNFPRRPANQSADAAPEPVRVLRERVEAPRSPAALVDGGVRVALQAGGGYGDFLANLRRATESGLSRDAALRALTIVPAELFGVADRLGTIETGKIANLTLVRGDVFEAGSRVTHVFADGELLEVRAPAGGARTTAAPVAGTWTMTVTLDGADRPATLLVQQQGEQLRGTLQGSLGTNSISNTTFADSAFRFTAIITLPDGSEEATFVGTLEGNTLRGTVTIVGHEPGTFVATRPNDAAPAGNRPAAGRPPRQGAATPPPVR